MTDHRDLVVGQRLKAGVLVGVVTLPFLEIEGARRDEACDQGHQAFLIIKVEAVAL